MQVRPDRRVVVAAALAASLLGIALADGGSGDAALAVVAAGSWVALLALALAGRIRSRAPVALLVAAGALLALTALTTLSLAWARSDGDAFVEALRMAAYTGVLVLAGLTAGRDRLEVVLAATASAVLAVAAISLGARLLFASGDVDLVAVLPSAAGRLSYPVGYWNALGAMMTLGLPPIAWLAATARGPSWRGAAMAAFAPPLLVAYMASSRGALIAAALGIGIVVAFAASRRRALAGSLVGVACSVPALAAATIASGILDTAGSGSPGRSEIVVLLALAVGGLVAWRAGPGLADRLAASRLLALRIPVRAWPLAFVVAIAAGVALAGPAALVGDVGGGGGEEPAQLRTVGVASVSGSGRSSFWEAALDAFAEEPVRGIGAGGYEGYWNAHGALAAPARNAHSEPLELLAELGLAGLGCFAALLGAVLVGGVAAARVRDGGPAGPALGIVVAGLVGFAVDWTWQFPAIAAPFLLAAGALAGSAPPGARLVRLPAVATAVALAALAAATIWGAGVVAAASSRLDASDRAIAEGRLDEAARAARAAVAVEPWAAEPWLRLAEAEGLAGNQLAALRAAREAVRLAPEDYRSWMLAADAQLRLGDPGLGNAYRARGISLYPLTVGRG